MVSQSGCSILPSHQRCMRVPFLYILASTGYYLCIYLFIYISAALVLVAACGIFCCDGWVGSSLQHMGFSLVVACRFSLQLQHTGSRARGLCSLRQVGSLVEALGLSSCGAWT